MCFGNEQTIENLRGYVTENTHIAHRTDTARIMLVTERPQITPYLLLTTLRPSALICAKPENES